MTKLMKEISRIFSSTRSILHKVFRKVTKGTSTAFKTVGATAATVLATIVVLAIFCLLVLISIPVGLITGSPQEKEKTTVINSQESNTSTTVLDEENIL